jgi:hypothetical protein
MLLDREMNTRGRLMLWDIVVEATASSLELKVELRVVPADRLAHLKACETRR